MSGVISILAIPACKTPLFRDVFSVWPERDKKIKNAAIIRNKLLDFISASVISRVKFQYVYQGL
jgi:hypothetical protein